MDVGGNRAVSLVGCVSCSCSMLSAVLFLGDQNHFFCGARSRPLASRVSLCAAACRSAERPRARRARLSLCAVSGRSVNQELHNMSGRESHFHL